MLRPPGSPRVRPAPGGLIDLVAPLIAFDREERTMVASPTDHLLISPMRLIQTPVGLAVGRGLHGAVDHIPAGTTTNTTLFFGTGLVDNAPLGPANGNFAPRQRTQKAAGT